MHKDLHFYMPMNVSKSVLPGGEEVWEFEGLASTDDVDLMGDVVYPDSFSESLEFFKSNGKIFYDHSYALQDEGWYESHNFSKEEMLSIKAPIGRPTDAYLTEGGLMIRGVLNKEHPMARIVWEKFLKNEDFAAQMGLSIGARYKERPRREYDIQKGRYVTYLPELLLYEVSVTPKPVNPHTWVTAMKSLASLPEEVPQYHTISPDSVIYDRDNNQLVIKSTVESEDGVHVFESYVNVKEDITNVSKDKKDKIDITKALNSPLEDEELLDEAAAAEAGALEAIDEAVEAEDEALEGVLDEELSVDEDAAVEAAVEEPVDEFVGNEVVDEAMEDAADASLLDELVEAGDTGPDTDATMSLLMDKIETMTDMLSVMMANFHAPAEQPAEMTEMSSDPLATLKTVDISEESLGALRGIMSYDAMKGLVSEIAMDILKSLTAESTLTMKSVGTGTLRAEREPAKPDVTLTGVTADDGVTEEVRKSVSLPGEDGIANKSEIRTLVAEYVKVRGSDVAASSKRAQVVTKAVNHFGITSGEFRGLVRQFDEGKF